MLVEPIATFYNDTNLLPGIAGEGGLACTELTITGVNLPLSTGGAMSARAESGSESPSVVGASSAPAGEIGFDLPAWQRVGCLRDPCGPEPDPALFFASPELKQIRETLLATLRRDPASVCVVTGPAGSGKTMLLRELAATLAQMRLKAVFLNCADIAAPWHEQLGTGGTRAVLLLDGAEQCGEPALDALEQWLTAGEGVRSGLRAVISGRPEIAARLQRLVDAAAGAGLATACVALEPLDTFMVGEFLAHRLWRSGFTATWPLSNAAVQRIADRSGGLPANIIRLAAPELEAAWATEAVFAPPLPGPAALVLAPSAALPAIVPPPAAQRPPSGPALRTALLASVLLGVAGTAGWLAWRTVESARLAVGLADAAPPAAPHRSVVAIPPPVLTPKPLASEEPAASTTVAEAAPATGPARPAGPQAATTVPVAIAEPVPPPSPAIAESPAVTESPAAAEAPRAIEPAPPVDPLPRAAATAAVVESAPTLALAEPPGASVPEAKAAAEAPAPAEPTTAVAAASPVEPSPVTDHPAQLPATAAEAAIALAALPAPASDADRPAVAAGSAPAAPAELAQAPTVQAPTAPAADPPAADPPAAAPSPAPAAEPASAPEPVAPPAALPSPGSIEPSAGAPPAAASPATRLNSEQAANYVRRGDELVGTGDIAGARLWYERAAVAGNPAAMQALGRTYDARMLRQWGVVGMPADPARAEQWYRKAAEAERAAPPRQ